MAAIVTRAGKGSPLTNTELDANFVNLNTELGGKGPGNVVGPAVSLDNALARWDTTTGKLLQSSPTLMNDAGDFTTLLVVNKSGIAAIPPIDAGDTLNLQGAGPGLPNRLMMHNWGVQSVLISRRANGTPAAPTAVLSGDVLFDTQARGYGATGWTSTTAGIAFWATENYTDAASGSHIRFRTTPNGSNAAVDRWIIENSGHLCPVASNVYDLGQSATPARIGYFAQRVRVDRSNVGPAAIDAGTLFQGNGLVLEPVRVELNACGHVPFVTGRVSNGQPNAPAGIGDGHAMLVMEGRGYDGAAWSGAQATVTLLAKETWSATAHGADVSFSTTARGTTAITGRWSITHDGGFIPQANNTYDIGSSGLRAHTGFFTAFDLGGANPAIYFNGPAATSAVNMITYTPSDYGAGKPQLFIQKAGTALTYVIGTWDGSGSPGTIQFATANVTMTGAVSATGGIQAGTGFHTSGSVAFWIYKTGDPSAAGLRWQVGQDNLAETGGNAGANFCINRYTDTGVFLDRILVIERATGLANFLGDMTFYTNGALCRPEPRGKYYAMNGLAVAAYTLVLADQGKLVWNTFATASTITIPPNSAVAFPLGARIDLSSLGAGQVSIAPGAGVTLYSAGTKRKLTGQFSGASLTKVNTDEWLLIGDLTA